MKKTIIFVTLAFLSVVGNAQEVIKLKEAKVEFSPVSQQITNLGNSFIVNIKETFNGEFEQDPVSFMKTHFDIKKVIAELEVKGFDSYQVSFKSRKGELNADFDNKGNLMATALKFENIIVPSQLQYQLYRDYKGWAMVKTLHVASESNGSIKEDFYKVIMKKGKKKVNLKINASDIGKSTMVAVN